MTGVEVVVADLADLTQQRAIIDLLDAYSQEPIISGKPLADDVRSQLIDGLRRHPTTVVLLAYAEDQPVGLAICFLGFSTFAAKPLLNIHDLAVLAEWRGRGVGTKLIAAAEAQARLSGCCKVTLEVFRNNERARKVYHAAEFSGDGEVFFLSKPL